MNYHEDGYGGYWFDDNDLTEDDPDYDYREDNYENWIDPQPYTLRERFIMWLQRQHRKIYDRTHRCEHCGERLINCKCLPF